MIAGIVTLKKVIDSGYMLCPGRLVPQIELADIEKNEELAKKAVRRQLSRLRNLRKRKKEVLAEIEANPLPVLKMQE